MFVNHWIRKSALVLALPLALACGGGDDDTGPSGSTGSMSATIGGVSWNANLTVQGAYTGGVLAIGGNGGSGANNYQVNITVTNITAAGTFNFGVGAIGNQALVTLIGNPVSTWGATFAGGSGSITVTSLTASRAQGTFTFTANASPGTAATGTKAVTNGQFDVRF